MTPEPPCRPTGNNIVIALASIAKTPPRSARSNGAASLILFGLLLIIGLALTRGTAHAVPTLQIYIEDSTYDPVTETWVITTSGSFKLWVIGDVGSKGTITGVNLSAAVLTAELGGTIGLTSTTATAGLLPSPGDPSAPVGPIPTAGNFPSADGAVPIRGDGSSLPTHDIYGPGVSFFEWDLGTFALTDSPVGDFINTFPTSFPSTGQVNAYTVDVSGFTQVHFDAYNHIYTGEKHGHYKFAPFSHDGGGVVVPEPPSLLLLGSGLIGLGFLSRKIKL